LKILDDGLKAPSYMFLVKWQQNLSRLGDLLQTLVETAALCKKKKSAQKDVNDAKAWVDEMGEVAASASKLPGWIWPLVYYFIPTICILLSPISQGMKVAGFFWPAFAPICLLGALLGLKDEGSIEGRSIFLGLLIDVGIIAVRRAMIKSEETSLDARKRERSDRSGKLSKESSALSAIDRSIREKDKQMKAAYESLCDKD
jgi:hypothetical protein